MPGRVRGPLRSIQNKQIYQINPSTDDLRQMALLETNLPGDARIAEHPGEPGAR